MFNIDERLKEKLRDFWEDELEEIKQNKFRVISLIMSFLFAISIVFIGDDGEKVDLNETPQIIEYSETKSAEISDSEENSLNKKTISVKKEIIGKKGEKIVAVLGANSEELTIGDPFQPVEEEAIKPVPEVVKVPDIPVQVPVMPPQLPPLPAQIPDFSSVSMQDFELPPIPSMNTQMLEKASPPSYEFILTGTAIEAEDKAAIIKKIPLTQGTNRPVENLIVGVGDSLEGRKIIDITSNFAVLDDGTVMYMSYLDGFISIQEDTYDEEVPDIQVSHQEIPLNRDNFSELKNGQIPIIPPIYEEIPPIKNESFAVESNKSPPVLTDEKQNSFLPVDNNLEISSNISADFPELSTDFYNSNITADNSTDDRVELSSDKVDADFSVEDNFIVK